jgi:hypothetical protein
MMSQFIFVFKTKSYYITAIASMETNVLVKDIIPMGTIILISARFFMETQLRMADMQFRASKLLCTKCKGFKEVFLTSKCRLAQ